MSLDRNLLLARALYDNNADDDDELSFRHDDILSVLEVDTDGMEGWWLCSLHGKMGLAPANRLQVIQNSGTLPATAVHKSVCTPGYPLSDYDVPQSRSPSECGSLNHSLLGFDRISKSPSSSEFDSDYDTPQPLEINKAGKPKSGTNLLKMFFGKKSPNVDTHDTYDTPVPSSRADGKYLKPETVTAKASNVKSKSNEKQKRKPGKTPAPLPPIPRATMSDRDSVLADYDEPSSNKPVPRSRQQSRECLSDAELSDYDVPHPSVEGQSLTMVKVQALKPGRDKCGQGGNKFSMGQESSAQMNKSSTIQWDKLMEAFQGQQKDVLSALRQITSSGPKWRESKNKVTRASVIRLSCVSTWKKLQSLCTCVSKLSVCGDGRKLLAGPLKSLNEQTDRLENVIGYLTTANSAMLDKDEFDYLTVLLKLASETEQNLHVLISIVETLPRDGDTMNNKQQQSDVVITVSPADDVDTDAVQRRSKMLPKPGLSKSTSSSNILEQCSNTSSVNAPVKPSAMIGKRSDQPVRRSLDSVLDSGSTEDYDVPHSFTVRDKNISNSSATLGSVLREDRNKNLLRWNASTETFEVEKGKRDAFVLDKGSRQFDLFQRRHSDCKASPVKMITGAMHGGGDVHAHVKGENSDYDNAEEEEEAVDYDYPMPSTSTAFESKDRMLLADKQLLQFYGRTIVDVTTRLKLTCTQLFQHVNEGDHKTTGGTEFINLAKSVLINTHNLMYIGDTILRNLTSESLKKCVQERCKDLSAAGDLKTIVSVGKLAAQDGAKALDGRTRLAECSKDILVAALRFAEVILRPPRL